MLENGISEEPSFFMPYIARRGADKSGKGMFFPIFGHIESFQVNAQVGSQLASQFRFSYTSGAGKEEACQWVFLCFQVRSAP